MIEVYAALYLVNFPFSLQLLITPQRLRRTTQRKFLPRANSVHEPQMPSCMPLDKFKLNRIVPRKGGSLMDQLADLTDPTPRDFDPEDAENYHGSERDSDDSSEESDDGRSHYQAVEKSRLRDTGVERPLKAEYNGQKSSRKDIFGEEPDESDEESGSENDMAQFERAEEMSFDEADSQSESAEEDSGSDHDSAQSSQGSSEDEVNSEDERQAAELKKMLANDQKVMLEDVVKTATADAEKGAAVKKQLAVYDSLLNARIKLQKGVQTTNEMCVAHANPTDQAVIDVEKSALDLLETIMSLREDMVDRDIATSRKSRKRKYNDGSHIELSTIWQDMQSLDTLLDPWRDQTLTKWSNKVQAASSIAKAKKFKALDQSIIAQMNELKSDRERLVKRTQIKRFETKQNTPSEATFAEIFDDGDYYQQMLKDLIDSRMVDSSNASQLRLTATKQQKQQKKQTNPDHRTSKDRRLRYDVHEKIQNFMAPMPMGSWHAEQIDELFGSLFGRKLVPDAIEPVAAEEVELGDDYRIFG